MPLVKVKENGSFENAVRKFKKQCDNEGIISEVRSRLHYDKPSVKKKKKSIAARKKINKSLRSSR